MRFNKKWPRTQMAESTSPCSGLQHFYELQRNESHDSFSSSDQEKQDEIYVLIKFLGRGSFGTVNLYQNTVDNSLVVWKEIDLKRLDSKLRGEAFAEVEILAMLDHPNIISYFKHFISDETLYIELEYAKSGTLTSLIKQQKSSGTYYDQDTVLWYFYQLVGAIDYIHDIGIMHRDIKTLNIFFMQSGLLKLGDFGIAKILDSNMDLAETQVGTPLYMSPEIVEGKKYSNKSDIWALGCVIYEICTLTRVFDASNQLKLAFRISLCDVLPINNETYTEDLKLLIKRILSKDPLSRPSAKEILKDDIFHDRSKEYDMRIERLNVIARNRQISSNMPQNTVIASKTFECLVWGGGKLKPKPIEKFQGDHAPLQVSLGPSHFAVITIEKELFTWAVSQGESRFLSAKLGHGKSYGYTRSPKQVDALSGTAIEQVSCGDDFTCCVSSNGDVYTFGTDYMGCLGLGQDINKDVLDENQSIYTPIKIPYFEKNSLKIVKVSCGELHSIALTESNQIFTWGYGEHGRLGHGDEDERYEPTELKFKFKYVFKDVFAGSDCSFLLTKDGRALAFGNNEFNKLCLNEITIGFKSDLKNIQGVSSIVQQLTPKIIKKLSPYHVVKICPGKTHTAAIDHYGRLFTFGNNRNGELGLNDFKQHSGLNLVSGPLNGHNVINAACGDTFTICATSGNQIFSWGNRKNGRLGIDSDVPEDQNSSTPFPKPIFGSLHLVSDMSSCYWNSIIIAERELNTKPVRSISYADYLRKETLNSRQEQNSVDSQSLLSFTPESSTGLVANRFERLRVDSPQVQFESDVSETTPEWLKKDIEDMDFIPMEALHNDYNKEKGKLVEQGIECDNEAEKYETMEEALVVIKALRLEIVELKDLNRMLMEKDQGSSG